MIRNSLDLSEKIDSFIVDLFDSIANIAGSLDTPFFIIGAIVRDMILTDFYGIHTARKSNDIDIGVSVSDWDQYTKLREALIATRDFEPTTEGRQRLKYKGSLRIDLIPFGAISNPNHSFSWPPEHQIVMNTLGFEESYDNSLFVRMREEPLLEINVATLAGLVLLKIISWKDKYPERTRDAKDLKLIIRYYLDAGNSDRLFEEELDIIDDLKQRGEADYMKAAARLLGRDLVAISNPKTIKRLIEILDEETGDRDRYVLAEDMIDDRSAFSAEFEENLELLEELRSGILERL